MKSPKKLIQLAESLAVPLPSDMPDFNFFTKLHCNFSGGKDSLAFVLLLLYGYKVPREKMLLVHMRVDGKPNQPAYFDYPETDEYLEYCSKLLNVDLVILASEKGLKQRIEERGKWPGPQQQYCTSSVKRDVYAKWVRQHGAGHYLCLSGERASESIRRANNLRKENFKVYSAANAPTKNRYAYWYRPIHHLSEHDVWNLIKYAGIEPHPCYTKYKVSRCSCKFCIYLSPSEMLSVAEAFPEQFQDLVEMEKRMGHTMKFLKEESITLEEFISKAKNQYDQLELFRDTLPCSSF